MPRTFAHSVLTAAAVKQVLLSPHHGGAEGDTEVAAPAATLQGSGRADT